MQASPDDGTLSSFFLYTGAPFGTATSEIDFEFLGSDTTRVLTTFHTPEGSSGEYVDLGFDAAEGLHTYAFEWGPDSISWYADDVLLREVVDPEIGTPADPGYLFMNIWTGANGFTGTPVHNVSTTATYSDVSYTPRTDPVAIGDRSDIGVGGTVAIDVLANDGVMGGTPLPGSVIIDEGPLHGTVAVDPMTGSSPTPQIRDMSVSTPSPTRMSDGRALSNSGDVLIVAVYLYLRVLHLRGFWVCLRGRRVPRDGAAGLRLGRGDERGAAGDAGRRQHQVDGHRHLGRLEPQLRQRGRAGGHADGALPDRADQRPRCRRVRRGAGRSRRHRLQPLHPRGDRQRHRDASTPASSRRRSISARWGRGRTS